MVKSMVKKIGVFIILLSFIAMLSACGPKGADDVVSDLSKQLESMTGYKMKAVLTLQTGKDPQSYNVEVWHKNPDFYRVALTSEERDITQIILRNEEGVFVLTPHLKKSFRFQSGWPENHGQVYLYESLIKSIIDDDARVFKTENDKYVFEVKADYQNRSLTSQRIVLTKDLEPVRVEVMDNNKQVMVAVDFSDFENNAKFDGDSFNKERNLETAKLDSVPAMADGAKDAASKSFGVIEPSYTPDGITYTGVEKVKGEEGPQVVLRYKGDYSYTLFESRPKASAVTYPSGDVVDLGFTVGIMTGEDKKSLTWSYDGVEYMLTGDLPADEMVQVAKSTFNQVGK